MYEPTTTLALMDYIPVLFFRIGILYLLRVGYRYLTSILYTAMAGGGIMLRGGFYKATSKLIEASSGQFILALETSQFVMLAPGFVLLFISVLGLLKSSPSKGLLTVSGMEMWKIPFIAVMTLANLGFLVVLAVFARRNRLHIPAALYILSALAMLAMGYLSTQAFTTGMHWLAQSVNSLVQLLAMARHIALYRGLSTEAPTTHSVATS